MQQYTRAVANAKRELTSMEQTIDEEVDQIEVSASMIFNYDTEALHYEDLGE